MNNKVTINPQLILKYDFKHLFTYRLLNHIMAYYDTELRRVRLDKNELIIKYGVSNKTVKDVIQELIDTKIIAPYNYYKNRYSVDNKIFINFVNGITL